MRRAVIMRYLLEQLDDICLSAAGSEELCDECPFDERCRTLLKNGKSPFIDGEEDE